MKLSINTYVICAGWPLDGLIQACRSTGYGAIEFRAESGQKHGVELEATPAQRSEIRRKLEDGYLEACCISTSQCLHQLDPVRRRDNVDRAKQHVDLAADINCRAIRVFGDGDPIGPDMDARDAIRTTGDALRAVAEHAAATQVDVLFEMHGQFNFWGYALGVVQHADHPKVGLTYNCVSRDLVGGAIGETYSRICDRVRHVHMHDLEADYPYLELFRLLHEDGYDGYCSLEVDYQGGDPEKVMALYAVLWRTQLALAAAM